MGIGNKARATASISRTFDKEWNGLLRPWKMLRSRNEAGRSDSRQSEILLPNVKSMDGWSDSWSDSSIPASKAKVMSRMMFAALLFFATAYMPNAGRESAAMHERIISNI